MFNILQHNTCSQLLVTVVVQLQQHMQDKCKPVTIIIQPEILLNQYQVLFAHKHNENSNNILPYFLKQVTPRYDTAHEIQNTATCNVFHS